MSALQVNWQTANMRQKSVLLARKAVLTAKRFTMLSDSYMNAMSDHYPIYTDLEI